MQPCLRRKVQNRISSALQRRNQVPYYLPDHLWQQWIPAGEFRSSFQTKKERICWVTASQQAKAVDDKNCEARSAEEVKHWFKYQRYSWMNFSYERFKSKALIQVAKIFMDELHLWTVSLMVKKNLKRVASLGNFFPSFFALLLIESSKWAVCLVDLTLHICRV